MKSMVDHVIRIAACAGLATAAGCATPTIDVASAPFSRESIEWQDLWVEHADSSELPRVLMLGDSISRQYRGRVSPHPSKSGCQIDGKCVIDVCCILIKCAKPNLNIFIKCA